MPIETPQTQFQPRQLPREFRTPLAGELAVTPELLAEIRSRHPETILSDTRAVHAYFAQTWVALNEIAHRPEIKSLAGDVEQPPAAVFAGAYATAMAVTPEEEAAFESWRQDRFGGEPLAQLSMARLQDLRDDIRSFVEERLPDFDAQSEGGAGGDINEIYDAILSNQMVYESEEDKRRLEEMFAQIKSGAIKDAGQMLEAMTYLELTRINRLIGRALSVRQEMQDGFDRRVAEQELTGQGGAGSITATSVFNAEVAKFSGDSGMINHVLQFLFNGREQAMTRHASISQLMGRPGEVMNQNMGRAASG